MAVKTRAPYGFVRRARRLGFTAAEIDDLISVRWLGGACEAVQGMIQAKRRELRRRMSALEVRDMALTTLLVECWKHETAGPCPVRWDFRHGETTAKARYVERKLSET